MQKVLNIYLYLAPILVAARSQARVGGRSLAAGIPGSNPSGVMNICLL